jgi:hypothetical protein
MAVDGSIVSALLAHAKALRALAQAGREIGMRLKDSGLLAQAEVDDRAAAILEHQARAQCSGHEPEGTKP